MEYRVEEKYVCTEGELLILTGRLSPLMQEDAHHGEERRYQIRSLYFDDYENSCFAETMDGVNDRKKFRIRIYGGCSDKISLEVKFKRNGMTRKDSCMLTEEQCSAIMAGKVPVYKKDAPKVLRMLYLSMQTMLLRPVVIVQYERTAFVNKAGNVRVTFDRNISASADIRRFLDPKVRVLPVMEKGKHILEVKYDEVLPAYIAQALETGRLQQTPYSKYRECRIAAEAYNTGGML